MGQMPDGAISAIRATGHQKEDLFGFSMCLLGGLAVRILAEARGLHSRPNTSLTRDWTMRFAALLTQRLTQRLACALLSLLPLWATAMTLETQGDTVFATGPVGNDLLAFETHLANPAVKQVVFVNSPGGDLWTGLRVGRLIASKSLRTVAAGNCASSCAVMFMGGQERRFSDALPPNLTWVGIHGAHAKDTKRVDPVLQPQMFAWFKLAMGERFDSAVMNQALYEMDDAGGMLRVYDTAHRVCTGGRDDDGRDHPPRVGDADLARRVPAC